MGFEQERVRFEHISATEAVEYTQIVNEFTEEVANLGPNKLNKKGLAEYLNEQELINAEPEVKK